VIILSQFISNIDPKQLYTWLLLGEELQGGFVLFHRLLETVVRKQLFLGLGRLLRICCCPVLRIFIFNKVLTEKTRKLI
jgi:hypothetical protein